MQTQTSYFTYLSTTGVVTVSGADAASFLQGQLTCDVREIHATQSRLGAYCNLQGRIHCSLRLLQQNDHYLALLHRDLIASTLKKLTLYKLRAKVELTDNSEAFAVIGLQLDATNQDSLQALISTWPTAPDAVNTDANGISIIRLPYGNQRYLLVIPAGSQEHCLQQLHSHVPEQPMTQWYMDDISHGYATITPDIQDTFLPHELNYPHWHAVSFQKGCYLGQEIVARMEYRGQLKRHLHYLQGVTEASLQPGQWLQLSPESQPVTHIVNCISSSKNHYTLLAVAQDNNVNATPLYTASGKDVSITWHNL